jgi:hypothetical protein
MKALIKPLALAAVLAAAATGVQAQAILKIG